MGGGPAGRLGAMSSEQAIARGCPRCGLVQATPTVPPGHVARCVRCAAVLRRPGGTSANRLTAAIALAALILFPVGMALPVMRLQQFGYTRDTSIWGGAVAMLAHGQWLIGLVVVLCSIVIPLLKLLGLFVLTIGGDTGMKIAPRHQARVYRVIELAGRWGMLDVLLLAVLVAAVKLGDVVQVTAGPGVVAFTATVMLSLLASAVFDPHAIWETQ
jgi:uncharacterized paraquat-inducible protein A